MAFGFGRKKDEAPADAPAREGWFGRLRAGLAKTREGFMGRLGAALGRRPRLDAETIEELEEVLYAADLGPLTVEKVLGKLRQGEGGKGEPAGRLRSLLREMLDRPAVPPPAMPSVPSPGEPLVILMVGVNGAGKTTTAGKLAARYAAQGRQVMLAAADTFRAGAGEQIAVWAERAGCGLVRLQEGADPSAVVFDALQAAKARGAEVLLADTAGRLHTKKNLMEELKKVRRVADRLVPGAPHEVLLVLDATTGQNALAQVREFGAALGVTGLVLTKLDGSAKGGVVVGAAHESGIPVRYVGVGEGVEDLLDFDPDAFIAALFGEGESGAESEPAS
ncbi:MAG: signal recognition particle-docking protein FtsY [Candidatus Tectomicrobia bacterium]|nr:signal recognition particle-docking protein FtsY [Candidatus Tectomicrobia bacterium]